MPGRDGTGPFGEGPLTGRGLGPCGKGLAWRRGFKNRRFWRLQPWYYSRMPELSMDEQKKFLQEELEEIKEEIKILEKEKEEIENKLKVLG
ncbi:MAG: DUF5320 domain-containing protein [Candidatus Aenigmarchaeota archaeon]|nr:DUF5320 domain-containing protein [Candidatus Aenigmarchaeota archaeon]